MQKTEDMLAKMQTTLGISVLELSKKHRVSLSFTKWLGCPLCQKVVADLSDFFPTFLKMNTIPVVCHQETIDEGSNYVNTLFPKDSLVGKLPRVGGIGKDVHSHFKLKNASFWEHVKTIPAMVKLGRNFSFPLASVANPFVEFGLFLIENGAIVSTWKFKCLSERPDYGQYLQTIGPCNQESLQQVQHLDKLFPGVMAAKTAVYSIGNSNAVRPISITLEETLLNATLREQFKIFVTNEHSIENILFLEHVESFKNLTQTARLKCAQHILETFISVGSPMELNINKPMRDAVLHDLNTQTLPNPTVFDGIVLELMCTVLSDSFARFLNAK